MDDGHHHSAKRKTDADYERVFKHGGCSVLKACQQRKDIQDLYQIDDSKKQAQSTA